MKNFLSHFFPYHRQKCEEELKKKDEEIKALKSSTSGKMKTNQHKKSCMDLDSLQRR